METTDRTRRVARVNHESGFDFIMPLQSLDGRPLGWPEHDWEVLLWTVSSEEAVRAGCRDGVPYGCFNDNGEVHVVVPQGHGLSRGRLYSKARVLHPNSIYPDGRQLIVSPECLDIELVRGKGDLGVDIEAMVTLPYVKGDPGSALTYDDLTPEQIQALQRPATEAAEKFGEFAREAEANEQERVEAESERQEAERQRVETFAGFGAVIDSKADRSELSNIIGETPLTSGNFPGINTYTREELALDPFIDLCRQHGVTYNRTTGCFGLNGLTDITVAQMRAIYAAGVMYAGDTLRRYRNNTAIRTTLPPKLGYNVAAVGEETFTECTSLEVARCGLLTASSYIFHSCTSLREARLYSINDSRGVGTQFRGCRELRSLVFNVVYPYNIDLRDSPLLELPVFERIVDKYSNSKTITVTVHPDVYAKLTDEDNTEWHRVLTGAASKNIIFATTN